MPDIMQAQGALQSLRDQVNKISAIVDSKEKALILKESQLRQKQIGFSGPRDLEANLQSSLGPQFAPGNVGDINKVVWPYWFSTDTPPAPIPPGGIFTTGFTNTYEAMFIWMSTTKAIYLVNIPIFPPPPPPPPLPPFPAYWFYLNPNNESNDNNLAPGLYFTLRDNSSMRQFYNQPIPISAHGNPRFPFKFPRPMMILPNQEIQVQWTNQHPTNSYVPILNVFGYRMRVEDSQQFLGLVNS